ncbi:cyclopropane-fatty-acyl-phospholipid synthase [Marinobacterium nitratireducens]|uniref:Cyclopropane-fatty-acyl-phospholipid synthase n=1 Tax=Marinobacterium nitratireducens TaxID=518897 RepID=A0A917ZP15_9GAMM|nr:cyclopropane fatty acyl phospholipid synthase [Marinobacterium nitratireducens]GGO87549.1 cyclopropane-fatty-acyl-phospholipid synthase [Marinobacterium nitratireducens]
MPGRELEFDYNGATSDISTPKVLQELLARADVRINGPHPWDIQVRDARVFRAVLLKGSLGFGESYVDGHWECSDLAGLMTRLLNARLDEAPRGLARVFHGFHELRNRVCNLQSVRRAFHVGERHYDIGNDLYAAMLDAHWCYSCGYWSQADHLDAAQEAKLDLICRKLQLEPGMKVLEVGCGWGSLAHFMASRYEVEVHGITVSREQAEMAAERCAGLKVAIELVDYREVRGRYDRIVSVGMFEHVGHKNYRTYFSSLSDCLAPDGLFLLHTIGTEHSASGLDPWIDRYIFPNGELPSMPRLTAALPDGMVIEDLHNFGPDYERTLLAWWQNFQLAWPKLSSRYDERFARMWRYYLLSCAAFFRSRRGQLWQMVLAPVNRAEAYRSVR